MEQIVWTQDWEQGLLARVKERMDTMPDDPNCIVRAWSEVARELAHELHEAREHD